MRTDSNGYFSFEFVWKPQALVIANEYGFCLGQGRDMTNHPLLVVRPWGIIEGVRTDHGRPFSNHRLAVQIVDRDVDTINLNMIQLETEASTDTNGHFRFAKVPPVDVFVEDVYPYLRSDTSRRYTKARLEELNVLPGLTNHIDLSTQGRTVIGHLDLGPGLADTFDVRSLDKFVALGLEVDGFDPRKRPPVPPEFDTAEKRGPWYRAWYNTAAGRKRQMAVLQLRVVMIREDGSFIAQMVQPGNYVLHGNTWGTEHEAIVDRLSFVVPPATNEPSDSAPIDVGTAILRAPVNLKVGDVAPEINAPSITGGTIKLSDFRGKYVLLDFWATWCGPCVKETPYLQATFQAFGTNARFAMIGLSCDSSPEAPRKFVESKNIGWHQAFLGDNWSKDPVSQGYGITAIPQIILIGPDGRIAARDLRGEKIKETVAAILGG